MLRDMEVVSGMLTGPILLCVDWDVRLTSAGKDGLKCLE